MLVPNRHEDSGKYRYGFNGMEKDDEVKGGNGNSYDFGARMYDSRIGRWMSRDPLFTSYPAISPYVYAGNSPILFVDYDGNDFGIKINHKTKTIIIVANIYTINNKTFSQAQKGVSQWNNLKDIKIDGYSVKFNLVVKAPPEITDEDVIAHFKKKDKIVYNSLFKKNGKKRKGLFKKKKKLLAALEASIQYANDDIGNIYFGAVSDRMRKSSTFGGQASSNGIAMFNDEELGDLGNYSDLVAHEIGHLLGLNDIGGEYFSEKGIMKYKGTYLNPIHREDVQLILNYARDVLNGYIKNIGAGTGADTGNPTVKLTENKGKSDGCNPIDVEAKTEENETDEK